MKIRIKGEDHINKGEDHINMMILNGFVAGIITYGIYILTDFKGIFFLILFSLLFIVLNEWMNK